MLWNTLCAEKYQILRKAVPAKGGGGEARRVNTPTFENIIFFTIFNLYLTYLM